MPVQGGRGTFKLSQLIAVLTLLPLAVSAYAQAPGSVPQEDRQEIDVRSQSVGDALLDLAMQLGVEVFLFGDDAGMLRAKPLHGNYTASEALKELLAGTNLEYRYTGEGTIFVGTPERLTSALQAAGGTAPAPVRPTNLQAAQAAIAETDPQEDRPGTGDRDAIDLEEIVVTGSRIARSGFDTPTPVSVLSAERIENSAVSDIGELLLQTPAIAVGESSINANFSQDAGASFVNLRGMGTDRTLVLVDGRRRVSGGQSLSAVDLATIPANLIERVETITGGASAVYGADAVTGVVNVVLKNDFEGLEFTARANAPEDSGAENYSLGMHAGTAFDGGRGNVNFGLSYDKSNYLRPHQRDFAASDFRMVPNPENTGPDDGIPDSIHIDNHRIPGLVRSGAFYVPGTFTPVSGDLIYTYDNGLRPTENEIYYQGRAGFSAIGGQDGFSVAEMNQLRPEQEVIAAMTHFNYQLSDGIEFYTHAQFANTRTLDHTQPFFDTPGSIIISRDNALVPDEVVALLDDNGLTEFSVSRFHFDQGTQEEEIERNTYSVDLGTRGEFANGWQWDTYLQYGRYMAHKKKYTRIEDRFYKAIDAIELDGEIVCADPVAREQGCVPLSLFGANAATQEAMDYMKHYRLQDFTNTLSMAGAQLNGDLLELPAGAMQFAFGTEYRKETSLFRNDGLAATNQLFRFDNGQVNSDAEFDVTEAFVEVLVPVLTDAPMFHELNLEGAVRYSDYSHVDATTAWKLGADWALTADLRIRATRSNSVRAPNLSETFNPGNIQNIGNIDPCDIDLIDTSPTRRANCEALGVPDGFRDEGAQGDFALVGGNPNLEPEKAESWTFGLVMTPEFLPELRMTVDYWDIEINGAINTPVAQTIIDRCVDLPSVDNVFCTLVQRRPSFEVEYIAVTDVNIGSLTARGVDAQVQYTTDAPFVPGALTASFLGTWLLEHEELFDATDPTTLIIRTGETSHPEFRGTLILGWDNERYSVDLLTRIVGAATVDKQAAPEASDRPKVDSEIYNDLVVGFDLSEKWSLTAGINNMFYTKPPRTLATYRGNFASGGLYDVVGRTYFLGAKVSF